MKPKQGGVISRVFSYGMMLISSIFVMTVWLYFLGSEAAVWTQIHTQSPKSSLLPSPVRVMTCLMSTPQQCSLPAYSPPTGSCHCNEIINAIDATCLSLWWWGWWVFNLGPSIYRTASERNQRQQQWICQTSAPHICTDCDEASRPSYSQFDMNIVRLLTSRVSWWEQDETREQMFGGPHLWALVSFPWSIIGLVWEGWRTSSPSAHAFMEASWQSCNHCHHNKLHIPDIILQTHNRHSDHIILLVLQTAALFRSSPGS